MHNPYKDLWVCLLVIFFAPFKAVIPEDAWDSMANQVISIDNKYNG